MKKHIITLATLTAGISCTTYAMQHPLQSYGNAQQAGHQRTEFFNHVDQFTADNRFTPQESGWFQPTYALPSKEERKARKLILRENKFVYKQALLCTEFLRTYNNGPVIQATEETRQNTALFLQFWSERLNVDGYTMPEWRQSFEDTQQK